MTISISLTDIIILMVMAIVLGFTIHFFISSRRNLKTRFPATPPKNDTQLNEWKLKYLNEVEVKDKELASLRQQLMESEENSNINAIEADETRKQNKKLIAELEQLKKAAPVQAGTSELPKLDYYDQLRLAQESLTEHNEKINLLLNNIEVIRETEEKQQVIIKDNEELNNQVEELRQLVSQKEQEIMSIRQGANLSREMSSMLDNAYSEFSSLQEKMQKLESQVNASKKINMEYEDIKEEHFKLRKDYEDQRTRLNAISSEHRELQSQLAEAQDAYKEVNFQRQQLQKRVAYLEELNEDLQVVSDTNKRLEGQIKRIGELESMLNVIAEERDQLMRRGG